MTPQEEANELVEKIRKITRFSKYDYAHDVIAKCQVDALAHIVADKVVSALRAIYGEDEVKQPDIAYYLKVKNRNR